MPVPRRSCATSTASGKRDTIFSLAFTPCGIPPLQTPHRCATSELHFARRLVPRPFFRATASLSTPNKHCICYAHVSTRSSRKRIWLRPVFAPLAIAHPRTSPPTTVLPYGLLPQELRLRTTLRIRAFAILMPKPKIHLIVEFLPGHGGSFLIRIVLILRDLIRRGTGCLRSGLARLSRMSL